MGPNIFILFMFALTPSEYFTEGSEYAKKSEPEKAIEYYSEALKDGLSGFSKAEQITMVKYLGGHDRRGEAIDYLRIILKSDPDFVQARMFLSVYLTHEKQYEEAEEEIDFVLEQAPNNISAQLLKANLLLAQDEFDQAIALYESVLEQKKTVPVQMALMIAYIKNKEYAKAESLLGQIDPETPEQEKRVARYAELLEKIKSQLVLKKAYGYVKERAFECAELFLLNYLREKPSDQIVRLGLARIYGLDGLFNKAFRHLCCVLRDEPENLKARILQAELFRWKGDYVRSIFLFKQLLREHKTNTIKLGLSYAYIGIGNRSGANQFVSGLKNARLNKGLQRKPFVFADYRFLKDTQNLEINQLTTRLGWWWGNCAYNLNYRHIDSGSPRFGGHLDHLFGQLSLPVNVWTDFGVNLGVVHANGNTYITRGGRALWRLPRGRLFVTSNYDIYKGTAESIENHVRYWRNIVSYTTDVSERDTWGGVYTYTKYSNANHANRINLNLTRLVRRKVKSSCYQVPFNPRIHARYDITYADTKSPTEAEGYFSGKDYFENRMTILISLLNKKNRSVLELNPNGSYSTYSTGRRRLRGLFYGGVLNFNSEFSENLLLTAAAKAGSYRYVGGVKYDYYEIAARLRYAF